MLRTLTFTVLFAHYLYTLQSGVRTLVYLYFHCIYFRFYCIFYHIHLVASYFSIVYISLQYILQYMYCALYNFTVKYTNNCKCIYNYIATKYHVGSICTVSCTFYKRVFSTFHATVFSLLLTVNSKKQQGAQKNCFNASFDRLNSWLIITAEFPLESTGQFGLAGSYARRVAAKKSK